MRPYGEDVAAPQPSFSTLPHMPQPVTGIAKALAFARAMSSGAVALSLLVLTGQVVLPADYRPSDLIGGFTGATHTAQLNAERDAQVRTAQEVTNAQTGAAARWQMETMLSQNQQQEIARSLTTQGNFADLADLSCLTGGVVAGLFGPDAAKLAQMLQHTCGVGNQLRDNISDTLSRHLRNGSGINLRPVEAVQPQR